MITTPVWKGENEDMTQPDDKRLIRIEAHLMELKTIFAIEGRLKQAEAVADIVHKYLYDLGPSYYKAVGDDRFLDALCTKLSDALDVRRLRRERLN